MLHPGMLLKGNFLNSTTLGIKPDLLLNTGFLLLFEMTDWDSLAIVTQSVRWHKKKIIIPLPGLPDVIPAKAGHGSRFIGKSILKNSPSGFGGYMNSGQGRAGDKSIPARRGRDWSQLFFLCYHPQRYYFTIVIEQKARFFARSKFISACRWMIRCMECCIG